jgi:hypothetical protein
MKRERTQEKKSIWTCIANTKNCISDTNSATVKWKGYIELDIFMKKHHGKQAL